MVQWIELRIDMRNLHAFKSQMQQRLVLSKTGWAQVRMNNTLEMKPVPNNTQFSPSLALKSRLVGILKNMINMYIAWVTEKGEIFI